MGWLDRVDDQVDALTHARALQESSRSAEACTLLDRVIRTTADPNTRADALVQRLVNASVLPDLLAHELAKAVREAVFADVAVVFILLVAGVLLGELVSQKSTREVIDGMSGPKFPSTELLLWLAGPVVLLLGYALLGSRGKSVGGWLRRRAKSN